MEKRIGSSAGILALIALVLHSLGFPGGEDKSVNAPDKKAPITETDTTEKGNLEIVDWQGPWRATQQYFHSDLTTRKTAKFCRDYLIGFDRPCSQRDLLSLFGFGPDFRVNDLQYLIATLPDPLHTRMALDTDRDLDAIQRAASLSKWELATCWLPWTARQAATGALKMTDLERYPGLLVFRRHFSLDAPSNQLLIVLVVAETPTAGINGFQFDSARRLVSRTGSAQPEKIRIAGPTFSGSFQSLTRLLGSWPDSHEFLVQAGSVSNSGSAQQMNLEFGLLDANKTRHSTITFHGSTLPTMAFEDQFKRLVSRLDLPFEQAAAINEGGTGFSASSSSADDIASYTYSRDLAQVRNQYNDAAFTNPAAKKNSASASPLEFSLKDAQLGEDGFPMFSTNHTPASKNAELLQMIRSLKQRGVRIASLSATNVFDTLFLANVLRRNCPDLRIVLRSTDLLFGQESSQNSLSGLMAISSFPPPELEKWSRSNKTDIDVFASDDQMGEFLAVAALLHPGTWPAGNTLPISPAWLLELGSSGWHAIDFLQQANPFMKADSDWFDWFDSRLLRPAAEPPPLGRARLRWILLCLAMAFVTFAFCGRLFYLKLRPGLMVGSVLCMSDLEGPERRRAVTDIVHHRYLCLIAGYAVLAFLNGLLLSPMAAAHLRYGGSINPVLELAVFVAFAIALFTVFYLIFIVPVRVCRGGPMETCSGKTPISRHAVAMRVLVAVILLGCLQLWWAVCDSGISGYLLCFRTFNLSIPLSPLLPLLIVGVGLFLLTYFQLRRFTWGDRRQPHLDTSVFDEELCNEFRDYKMRLERNLCRPGSFRKAAGIPFSLALSMLAIAAMFAFVTAFKPRSFEPSGFLWLFIFLQIILAVFSFSSFLRFLQPWSLLKGFLVSLNSVVLGRYIDRLPEFSGNGPVWMREVKLKSLTNSIDSGIALHNLERTKCVDPIYSRRLFGSLKKVLNPAHEEQPTRLTFLVYYQAFRKTAAEISAELGKLVLRPYWKSHDLPYVGHHFVQGTESQTAETAAAEAAAGIPNLLSDALAKTSRPRHITNEAYEYASKYIALQYSVFIGYVLRHLQNLLLCSIACFVLIVVALNCFVFQFPEALSYCLAAVLVLSGLKVLLVLAQLERDPIFSRLSGTHPGELGKDFYFRAFAIGALPVLTVVSTQFPAVSRFLSSWVEPAVSKLH